MAKIEHNGMQASELSILDLLGMVGFYNGQLVIDNDSVVELYNRVSLPHFLPPHID